MPPVAVYVLAIASTVGAAIAFKHFVYDPHLSHVVRRWKEELRQWRRRTVDIQHRDADQPDVPMHETEWPSRIRKSDDTAISSSYEAMGTRDGLLSRSRLRNLLREENLTLSSIELDNLVAREISEWGHELPTSSGQDLRQRNVADSASRQDAYHNGHGPLELEEDTKPLPYVPLSPRRTHVVCDSGDMSPATPALDIISNGLPSPPLTTTSPGMHGDSLPSPSQTASQLIGSPSLGGSMTRSQDPLLRRPLMQTKPGGIQVSQNMDLRPDTSATSPIPTISLSRDFPSSSPLVSPDIPSPSLAGRLSPGRSQEQEQNSSFLHHVQSLSQSYPQELEIEHGVELLSPPSSRPDSPFSMANISPRAPALTHQSPDRVRHHSISPLSIGSTPSEGFSPAIQVEMGLGNESFDTLSPVMGPRQLALRAAGTPVVAGGSGSGTSPVSLGPFEPATETHSRDVSTPLSRTSSLKSSAYLSFSESESGNEADDDDVPLATRRASLILAMSGHSDSESPRVAGAAGGQQGLGLTFASPPSQRSPPPLSPSMLSPRSRLAEVSDSHYGLQPGRPIGPLSDTGELSDLDLMSDYTASSEPGEVVSYPGSVNGNEGRESLGTHSNPRPRRGANEVSDRESDASWSVVTDGSDFGDDDARLPGTPQLRPVGGMGGELKRDDTIRGRKNV